MGTLIIIVVSFAVGCVVGVLFGRKNKKKVEKTVADLKPILEKAKGEVKEKIDGVLKDLSR